RANVVRAGCRCRLTECCGRSTDRRRRNLARHRSHVVALQLAAHRVYRDGSRTQFAEDAVANISKERGYGIGVTRAFNELELHQPLDAIVCKQQVEHVGLRTRHATGCAVRRDATQDVCLQQEVWRGERVLLQEANCTLLSFARQRREALACAVAFLSFHAARDNRYVTQLSTPLPNESSVQLRNRLVALAGLFSGREEHWNQALDVAQ